MFAIAATYCPVYAQPNGHKLPIIKVPYSKRLPNGVIRRLPHGYRSLFYGTAQIDAKGPRVAVHFYEGKDQSKNSTQTADYEEREKCVIDIFTTANAKKGTQRLNSIHFQRVKAKASEEEYGVDILWLDPQQKRMPIIRLTLEDPDGAVGAAGSYILLVFPQGWTLSSMPKSSFGEPLIRLMAMLIISPFDSVDDRGLLMVERYALLQYARTKHLHHHAVALEWHPVRCCKEVTRLRQRNSSNSSLVSLPFSSHYFLSRKY